MTDTDIDDIEATQDGKSQQLNKAPWYSSSIWLRWLLGLALIYTLYFTKSLLLPILVALLLALLLNPLVVQLKRLYIPRTISAILLLSALCGFFTVLGTELVGPVQKWVRLLPELSDQLSEQIDSLSGALQPEGENPDSASESEADDSGFGFFNLFGSDEANARAQAENTGDNNPITQRIRQSGLEMMVYVLSATPVVMAQVVISVILVLFLLVFGPNLFNTVITMFPHIQDKRRILRLTGSVQKQLSRYILTISLVNAGLGLTTGTALWFLGLEDAVLWGVLIAVLNYAPYVGPIFGMALITLAGIAQYGMVLFALAPTLTYFLINLAESQIVTPLVLGRHMRLNPLLLVVWLLVWGWLWGGVGVLVAMPLLVSIKLTLDQMDIMPHWVRLIETPA